MGGRRVSKDPLIMETEGFQWTECKSEIHSRINYRQQSHGLHV